MERSQRMIEKEPDPVKHSLEEDCPPTPRGYVWIRERNPYAQRQESPYWWVLYRLKDRESNLGS